MENVIKEKHHDERVMDLAMEAGSILLENGAEISRVEETMQRICDHYDVHSQNTFVLSNGVFATAGSPREHMYAGVRHIPVSSANLSKVAAVNEVSREIAEGKLSIEESFDRLEEIRTSPGKRRITLTLASALSSGAFCYLFGGNLMDTGFAALAGFVLYIFMLYLGMNRRSKIVRNILGGLIVTLVCGGSYLMNESLHLNYMVIGSLMPLVPGLAFVNAIREITDGDYIAGAVRMLDAILVFVSIAIGVGFGIYLFTQLTGGRLL